jgi:hypothetical protein
MNKRITHTAENVQKVQYGIVVVAVVVVVVVVVALVTIKEKFKQRRVQFFGCKTDGVTARSLQ